MNNDIQWDGTNWYSDSIISENKKSERDAEIAAELNENQISDTNVSPVNSCPLHNHVTKPVKNSLCNFTTLEITKNGRNFNLVVTGKENEINVLEIIAGNKNKPSLVNCKINGVIGPCNNHNNKVIIFSDKELIKTNSNLQFKAYSPDVQWRWPWNVTPTIYGISANTCDNSLGAIVNVYQDLEIGLFLSFNSASEKKDLSYKSVDIQKTDKKRTSKNPTVTADTSDEQYKVDKISNDLSIGGFVKYDGNEIKSKVAFKDIIEKIQFVSGIYDTVTGKLKKIQNDAKDAAIDNIDRQKDDSVTIKKPSLEIDISGKWKELENDYKCSYSANIKVKAEPFIGIEAKMNITNFLLKASPVGIVLELLKKVNINALALILTVSGEVKGEVSIDILKDEIEKPQGEISGVATFIAQAILLSIDISKEIVVYKIEMHMELSINLETGITGHIKYESKAVIFNLESNEGGIYLVGNMTVGGSKKEYTSPPGWTPPQNSDSQVTEGSAPGKVLLYAFDKTPLCDDKKINFN